MPKSTVCEGCCETLSSVHCGAKQYYFFFCNKCKKKTSIRRKTILSFASISFRKLILLIYTFVACLWTYKQVKTEVSVSSSDDNSDDDSSSSSSFLSNKTISGNSTSEFDHIPTSSPIYTYKYTGRKYRQIAESTVIQVFDICNDHEIYFTARQQT